MTIFISKSLSNERTVYQKVMIKKLFFFLHEDKKYPLVLKSAVKKGDYAYSYTG